MKAWEKIKHGRKIMAAVQKVKRASKAWLCHDCKKKSRELTSKGANFFDLILESDKNFCKECSKGIKSTLK